MKLGQKLFSVSACFSLLAMRLSILIIMNADHIDISM